MLILANYFAIEGVDGSGKSTVLETLYPLLRARIGRTRAYHDPDPALPIGRAIYDLRAANTDLPDDARLALYAAGSIEAQAQALRTTSHDRYLIVSDRSAYTNHIEAGRVPVERFLSVHAGYRFPRLAFFLEVELALAVARSGERDDSGHEGDWLAHNFERVMARYAEAFAAAEAGGAGVVRVKVGAERTPEAVAAEILEHIARMAR